MSEQVASPEGQDQDPGHVPEAGMTDDGGDEGRVDWKDRFEDLNARYDLLNDSVAELRDAIVQSRQPVAAPQQVEDLDDDGELTGSKVKKIVGQEISRAVAQNAQVSERDRWDDKAKSDFPLHDAKFMREFKKEWGVMTKGGLDPNHPQAVYTVAKAVARGWNKPTKKAPSAETHQTSEAPTATPSGAPVSTGSSRRVSIDDNDPRLRFYQMRNDRTKEQIDRFKAKLAAKDAAEAEGRRGRR